MRTTSSVESMNAVFGRYFPATPHIFKFAECLRQFEFTKTSTLMCLINCTPNGQMNRKRIGAQDRDVKIKYFSAELEKKAISLVDFLDAMADEDKMPPDCMFLIFIVYDDCIK